VNHRRVREESQLNDMRAAIRGDFERLAERRGHQDLMHVREPEPEPDPEPEPAAEPGPEPSRDPEHAADVGSESLEPTADEAAKAPEEEPKRGFWARLLGL
jgi:hypothetical protein